MYCIDYFLRQFLTACQIHHTHFLIVKCVGEKQDMKVSLNVAVHTTASEVYIRVRFQIYGQDSSFLIQRITFLSVRNNHLRLKRASKENLPDNPWGLL